MKQDSNSTTARVVPPTRSARPQWRLASALMVLGGFAYLHFANGNLSLPTAPDTIVAETKHQKNPERSRSSMPEREVRAAPAMNHVRSMAPASASAPTDP